MDKVRIVIEGGANGAGVVTPVGIKMNGDTVELEYSDARMLISAGRARMVEIDAKAEATRARVETRKPTVETRDPKKGRGR